MKYLPYFIGLYQNLLKNDNPEQIVWILNRFNILFDICDRDYESFKKETELSTSQLENLSNIMLKTKF